ncbi:MAG: hypothetical protein KY462_13625 [Actinobacteria bacterium]|nr:hypothetical protein [Actinomycetota bacterium]
MDVDDLVTAGVIVVRMGLTRVQRVHELLRHSTAPMPPPVYTGPRIHLWLWSEVAAWARLAGREAVSPDDWVPAGLLVERLDVDPDDLTDDEHVAARRTREGRRWRWGDAEQVWIDRINRPRR